MPSATQAPGWCASKMSIRRATCPAPVTQYCAPWKPTVSSGKKPFSIRANAATPTRRRSNNYAAWPGLRLQLHPQATRRHCQARRRWTGLPRHLPRPSELRLHHCPGLHVPAGASSSPTASKAWLPAMSPPNAAISFCNVPTASMPTILPSLSTMPPRVSAMSSGVPTCLASTPRHIILQRLLGLDAPNYLHLPVVLDEHGRKLSKQTLAAPIDARAPLPGLLQAAAFLGTPIDHPRRPQASCWASAVPAWSRRRLDPLRGRRWRAGSNPCKS